MLYLVYFELHNGDRIRVAECPSISEAVALALVYENLREIHGGLDYHVRWSSLPNFEQEEVD